MNDTMDAPSHIVFRCDSSPEMGTGHVMRCLTMADVWRSDYGGISTFCCAQLSGSLKERINNGGYSITWLGDGLDFIDSGVGLLKVCELQNAAAVLIDGYHFDRAYREPLKASLFKVVTMQDAGSETNGADMVIDASPIAKIPANENSDKTVYAFVPEYALVAPSILAAQKLSVEPQGILITFGGSDPHGFSMPVANAIRSHLPDVPIHVVLGGSVANAEHIAHKLTEIPNITVSLDVASLGPAIIGAEMVITAAGSSLNEIAALARPMVLAITEDNQSELGALDWAKIIDVRNSSRAEEMIAEATVNLFQNQSKMNDMGKRAALNIDGKGAHRVLSRIKVLIEA